MIKIKICGVQSEEVAKAVASCGAHFIGIVFHASSKRFVDLPQAKKIAQSTKKHGGTPVAIFVDHTAEEMHDICVATNITTIQLHGYNARQQHHLLPAYYQRLYAQPVSENGEIPDIENGLLYCNPLRDYCLLDNPKAGAGQPFTWNKINYTGPFRLGVAGGLTPYNVALAIQTLRPALVDVSSGVENIGEKNIVLIKQFITEVNCASL